MSINRFSNSHCLLQSVEDKQADAELVRQQQARLQEENQRRKEKAAERKQKAAQKRKAQAAEQKAQEAAAKAEVNFIQATSSVVICMLCYSL